MAESKRRTRRKEARPQEILDSALELFAEQGFAATKMEAIAERAGIAKGTIYRYFPTKDALFEAIVRAGVLPIMEHAQALSMQEGSSATNLLKMLIESIYRGSKHSRERRVILMLLIAEGVKFPHLVEIFHRAVLQGAESLLKRIVEKGVASGEFRDGPACREPRVIVGPEILAAIWQSVFSAVSPLDEDKFMEAHIDLVLHGISKSNPGNTKDFQ